MRYYCCAIYLAFASQICLYSLSKMDDRTNLVSSFCHIIRFLSFDLPWILVHLFFTKCANTVMYTVKIKFNRTEKHRIPIKSQQAIRIRRNDNYSIVFKIVKDHNHSANGDSVQSKWGLLSASVMFVVVLSFVMHLVQL